MSVRPTPKRPIPEHLRRLQAEAEAADRAYVEALLTAHGETAKDRRHLTRAQRATRSVKLHKWRASTHARDPQLRALKEAMQAATEAWIAAHVAYWDQTNQGDLS